METIFSINCTGWIDSDGHVAKYEYYGKLEISKILKIIFFIVFFKQKKRVLKMIQSELELVIIHSVYLMLMYLMDLFTTHIESILW